MRRCCSSRTTPSVKETASLILEGGGLHVTGVEDGVEAVRQAASAPYDLLVLDVMLPSMSGFDVCREIRRNSQLPIIMLTARADLVDVVGGLELGADDHVTKPFEGAELLARVRAVLRNVAGRGACFTLTLPAAPAMSTAD